MSVTFSGGITFTGGGFSFTAAPPSTPTAGWYAGGAYSPPQSTVYRITFATDTATASVRSPLGATVYNTVGFGTNTYGYFAGGLRKPSGSPWLSTITRITFTNDTVTPESRGTLSIPTGGAGATSDNTTYGWIGGGVISGGSTSAVNKLTYATDTATPTSKGPLSASRYNLSATGTTSYGWFVAGFNPSASSTIDRITYANDTATASLRGPLVTALAMAAGAVTDGTTYGWIAGGLPAISSVQRITYATDTATASLRGPLGIVRYLASGTSDTIYGWFGGGYTPSESSSVTRITYATDTATSVDRGPFPTTRSATGAASGIQ